MTATEIARRFQARPSGHGWIARCPAHADRRPSLSIREGRDGRVLMRCHAGCETQAIVDTLGLRVHDLFGGEEGRRALPARRPISADDIEASLQTELARIIADESRACGFGVTPIIRHRNQAREIVERRLSVRLKRESVPWHEVEPHALDPQWSACIDQALCVAAACLGLALPAAWGAIGDLPRLQYRVLIHARRLQRSLLEPKPCTM